MANEAILRLRTHDPVPITVADGTAITKGALIKLTDENLGIITSAADDDIIGILARDKVANDGHTNAAVYQQGYFDMVFSGACTIGKAVSGAITANQVYQAPVSTNGMKIIGHSLGTAAALEVVLVKVNIGAGGNQIS